VQTDAPQPQPVPTGDVQAKKPQNSATSVVATPQMHEAPTPSAQDNQPQTPQQTTLSTNASASQPVEQVQANASEQSTDDPAAMPSKPTKEAKPARQAASVAEPDEAPAETDFRAPSSVASSPSSDSDTQPAKRNAEDMLTRIAMPELIQPHGAAPDAQTNVSVSSKANPVTPQMQFSELNHPKIVQAIHGQLLPDGGKMTLRLDPPELGAMNVRVEIRDGVINASFEASNDQTAKLLSHSLGDLKNALEAQGVSVEKLHVSQAPKEHDNPQNNSRRDSDRGTQDRTMQQEQQRREMMRRMWRRLMKNQDPLDLVA
jgi:flagellar hook-length control protein FliK